MYGTVHKTLVQIPTQLYLDNAQVEVLKWSVKSHMFPIEHLWDELGRRVYGHNVTSKVELEDALIAEYNAIHQHSYSMRRRARALIQAEGRATRY